MQQRRGPQDDLVILGVDRREHSHRGRGAQEPDVVRDPVTETRRDHEHLEPGVSVARKGRQLAGRRVGRIGHDDVECKVRERPLGIAQAAIDPGPKRSLLIDH